LPAGGQFKSIDCSKRESGGVLKTVLPAPSTAPTEVVQSTPGNMEVGRLAQLVTNEQSRADLTQARSNSVKSSPPSQAPAQNRSAMAAPTHDRLLSLLRAAAQEAAASKHAHVGAGKIRGESSNKSASGQAPGAMAGAGLRPRAEAWTSGVRGADQACTRAGGVHQDFDVSFKRNQLSASRLPESAPQEISATKRLMRSSTKPAADWTQTDYNAFLQTLAAVQAQAKKPPT
jgi:hypothetical protein